MEYNLWHTNRNKKSGEVPSRCIIGSTISVMYINIYLYTTALEIRDDIVS
jgi:hypothetical protein